MSIRVLAIGKKHEPWVEDGIERYSRRLRKPFDIEWVLLPHSSREGLTARLEESGRILARLASDDYVMVLDERGEQLDSPSFSRLLTNGFERRGNVTIVIGGAYGVDDELRGRAHTIVSLSPMVFPHQLVRLILAEQLYRAQSIKDGIPYHHD